jgi:hypothetical protein
VYDIYRYNTTLQSVRYLDTIQHNKVYDIYRYNTTQQSVRYLKMQYNTTNLYEKNLIFWFELFLNNVFWLQCPFIRRFRPMFVEFRFRLYPISNRRYANTEIRRDVSQDLAIFNSSHILPISVQLSLQHVSFSRHCLRQTKCDNVGYYVISWTLAVAFYYSNTNFDEFLRILYTL